MGTTLPTTPIGYCTSIACRYGAVCVPRSQLDPNVLWVGTEGSGLDRFDVQTGKFKHFTTEQGFPNNVIYAIQSDAHSNNLWISTNQGLCLFDPRTGHIRVYNQSDGLPGNEFNRYEYSRDARMESFILEAQVDWYTLTHAGLLYCCPSQQGHH
jgi:ligand-binding sensor domain-containing protein